MASNNEHLLLSDFIKNVHSDLRKSTSKLGVESAWRNHCANKDILNKYAKCMEKLATTHWDNKCVNNKSLAISRIKWAVDFCRSYFLDETYKFYRNKDIDIGLKIDLEVDTVSEYSNGIKLLDVGSCYNPFKAFDFLDVFAIDLCPANDSVYKCDFIDVAVGSSAVITDDFSVKQLEKSSFNVITFCFVLEYIPCSSLRVKACEKAYTLLKPGGLLIINTPDSKHVGANSKIMKCWRYTLACMGYSRIKYEKFTHLHCMAFRKSLKKKIAMRWALLHKEPYMDYTMNIPQDYNDNNCEDVNPIRLTTNLCTPDCDYFKELPFCEDFNCT